MEQDQVVAGVDWVREDHAVAVVDVTGWAVERFTVTHPEAGQQLNRRVEVRLQLPVTECVNR